METTTNKTALMKINGKMYTVVKAGEHTIQLAGPRGGEYLLVQNIHTGRWVLIKGNTVRPTVWAVSQMEAVNG